MKDTFVLQVFQTILLYGIFNKTTMADRLCKITQILTLFGKTHIFLLNYLLFCFSYLHCQLGFYTPFVFVFVNVPSCLRNCSRINIVHNIDNVCLYNCLDQKCSNGRSTPTIIAFVANYIPSQDGA